MPAHQSRFPVKPTLLAILLAFSAQQAIATECTWNVAAGNWAVLTNWAASCGTGNGNPAGTPGAADNATIGAAGVVTVDTAQRIGTVTNDGSLIVDASSLRVSGGITGSGSTTIQGAGLVNLEGTQTVGGNATIIFGTGANNRLGIDGGNKLVTFAAGTTIRGQSGFVGQGQLVNGSGNSVINQGLISSDSGNTITIVGLTAGLSNQNIMEATNAGSVLALQSNINNTGGTIRATASGTVLQQGVTVTGGAITTSGGGSYQLNGSGSNFLSGVTLSSGSLIDMASASSLARVVSGMTLNGTIDVNNASLLNFEGDQTLGGTGKIVFGSTASNNRIGVDGGNKTLTVASGVTIHGENGVIGLGQLVNGSGNALVNNGTISADVAGGVITLVGLTGGITNNGTISALNGGTLQLQSNLTGGSGSQLVAGAGSVISQQGVTVTGIVNTSGSGNLRANGSGSNFLSGVTLGGNLDMASATATERVVNDLVLNGTINVNNASLLNFEGNQTLSGNGSIVFGSTASNNRLGVDGGNKTLTVASGVTIRGENGVIGVGQLVNGSGNALVNNGTISADVAGGVITLAGLTGGITNNGTISALNGGTLQLQSNLVGSPGGQLVAGAGSAILQQGVTISGVINTSGSGNLRASGSGSNILSGVTLNGNLDMASATATERVINNLVLNGTITVNNSSLLNFEGDQTLSGNGSIVFGSTASNNRVGVDGGNKTLTVASGVTIRGENGSIGLGQLVNGSGNTIVNQGLIRSDSGGTINVAGAALVNQNIAEAVGAGSVLRLDSSVDNSAGVLRSTADGVVVQNGVTVSGGSITNSGGATYRINGSGTLSGVTLTSGSNIDLASAPATGRVNSGMTVNGTINIGSSSLLNFEGNQTLGGTGSIVFGAGGNNRVGVDGGNKTLTIASGVTIRGVDGSIGLGQLINGSGNAVINNGTINSDGGGTITVQGLNSGLTNNGLLRAQNGTLNVSTALSGTGTLQVDAAGTMNLMAGAKTQGQLAMGAPGAALTLSTGNLTINNDYTNVGAGTGNAFNRRAGVTGAGLIVAGGDAAQAITGTNVTNGNTANATLTIGNVRIGATSLDYQIANTGNTGPALRGAIQTSVNGANLNDARLSGTGVAAGNYNTGGPGSNTGNLGVTFTAANAGALAPLSGQVLNLRSNFENIADQKLNIVLAGGAAAYNAASGSAAPTPVTVANQRVGGANTAALTISNTAATGVFSEDLHASFGANGGAATNNGASIAGVVAGGNNVGTLSVGVNTTTSGAKTGTVTLNYQTAGAVGGVSNGLGVASVGSQAVTVNGNVYQAASGALQTAPLNFGTVQVGQSVSQNLVVRNTATGAAGFVEDLNASFGSASGTGAGLISGIGSLSGILAGSNSNAGNGTMIVNVNTGAAGVVNGNIAVNYFTAGAVNGVSNSLGSAAAGSENYGVAGTIQAQANVINQASPLINNPTITLGNVRVGAASPTQAVSIDNVATVAPQAALNATVSAAAPITASGSFNLLAPGGNSSKIMVGMQTGTAGARNGTATISFVSDASNVGNCAPNCQLNLASQDVSVSGAVYRLAKPTLNTPTINIAARVGDALSTSAASITNTSLDDIYTEGLKVNVSSTSGNAQGVSSIANLAAQGSAAIEVGLASTASAGVTSGSVNLGFVSTGAGTTGAADTEAQTASGSVTVNGKVYTTAVGQLTTPTVDFGIVRVGDAVGARNITVNNTAAATDLNDTLRVDLSGLGGPLSGNGSVSGIGAQASGNLAVGLNTGAAGVFEQTGAVSFLSHNQDMTDVSAGANANVLVKAQVNNLANADFDLLSGIGALTQSGNNYVLDLGNVTLGSLVNELLQLDNDVAGPADLLRGEFDLAAANDFTYAGWNQFLGLGAGQAVGGLSLAFNAVSLGLIEDSIAFNGFGYNASDPEGLAQMRTLLIRANVVDGGTVPEPGTLLLLVMAFAGMLLQRRRSMLH
ncbi:MAG: choice-of-anchor D domain-containing protein [Candidatus Accumulibacter sp.]|uniref:Choice-of-anchor D domain-containing protein n=1 Tax=Candidatus Accumulibacter affinis TaxID=2954384 RepID=A0A935W4R3_9PROT|nr:choice-of-anchor D domain-containing protein [Candidatus Accumulibacter affinis]